MFTNGYQVLTETELGNSPPGKVFSWAKVRI